MKPSAKIKIISASAGSGKTYRLAQLLEEEVTAGRVRPEAVLATTFTNKAAAQLQERVRIRLLAAGKVAEAQRLSAARMGTVNAVCGRLVSEFAFELGLSPELRVLDEDAAQIALRRSLTMVLTDTEEEELGALSERMVGFEWQAIVEMIVNRARSNDMTAQQVRSSAQRSKEQFLKLFGKPTQNADALDQALMDAMGGFVKSVRKGDDETQGTADALERVDAALRRMKAGVHLPWSEWVAMSKLSTGVRSDAAAEKVRAAAEEQDCHPRLREDVSRAIELVFELAARALESYQSHKREMGAIDFVDQESLALRLLGQKAVQDQLREELDLVLVDEFQDTSPIQLAIFLKLAEVAGRSIWVGDQKQAIYGFRDTDPALMDAAIESILQGGDPETLDKSYRSRPELVRFTSDLFAPSFERKGIPQRRTRLEPADDKESAGLGPVMECWQLDATNVDNDAAALATAVSQLLGDKVKVRDDKAGQTRPLRPGDVAILCRANKTCDALAARLAEQGIRAVLPRMGLMNRPEAHAVLAALRLWVDGDDSLAAAELGRLITYAGREDEWFGAILERPGTAAFADLAEVRAIADAKQRQPKLGALAAFDAVVEAIDARGACLRWGEPSVRLANLEALRSHAVGYTQGAATEGAGCTPAGLLAYMEELSAADADGQGVTTDEQAVVISTWHKAKGLEWPVTVLFGLGRWGGQALGVRIVNDRDEVRLDDPLAGRWIRCWPNPYHPGNTNLPFHEKLAKHPATKHAAASAEREDLRLLYVGWTRARDRVILASREGKLCEGMLELLADYKGPLVNEPSGDRITWAGRKLAIQLRQAAPSDPIETPLRPGEGYAAVGPKDYPPAFLQPSAVEGETSAPFTPETIGSRVPLTGDPDWAHLGNAVHGFLCADRPDLAAAERLEILKGLLGRWGVAQNVPAASVLTAADAFRNWADARWPGAVWHREWPVQQRTADGTIIRGLTDLIMEAAEGLIVIDHKSFPGSQQQALDRTQSHVGQLHAYAGIVAAATGKPVIGTWLHLPLMGIVLRLEQKL